MSDLGRVRSLPRRVPYGINGATMSRKGRVIKPFLTGNMGNRQGSLVVSLGRGHRFRIAHMVLEAFVGARPEGMLARHLDDDPYNNRVSNLMWGTYSENAYDAVRNKKNYQSIKTECPKGHPYDTVWSGGKQRARYGGLFSWGFRGDPKTYACADQSVGGAEAYLGTAGTVLGVGEEDPRGCTAKHGVGFGGGACVSGVGGGPEVGDCGGSCSRWWPTRRGVVGSSESAVLR